VYHSSVTAGQDSYHNQSTPVVAGNILKAAFKVLNIDFVAKNGFNRHAYIHTYIDSYSHSKIEPPTDLLIYKHISCYHNCIRTYIHLQSFLKLTMYCCSFLAVALIGNPCMPYDICMKIFVGEDADIGEKHSVLNC
jgi:hypothetical protein